MRDLVPELDGLPVGVLHVDLTGQVRALNACLAEWLGIDAAQARNQPVDQFLSPAGRVLYHTHLVPTVSQRGRLQELTLELQGSQGSLHALASAALCGEGAAAWIQLVLSPMRERLRIEAALLRVQRAADSAPQALFEYALESDGRGHLPYASAGLLTLYGVAPLRVHSADMPWLDHIHPDDRQAVLGARDASAQNLTLWHAEFRARVDADGPWRIHTLRAQPQREPQRVVWYGMVEDVTHQREVEKAASERDAAELATRAKTEFLARVSHELRTPLNAIIGFAHLLSEQGTTLDAEQHRRLGIIESSGYQLLSLIDEVLDISRIETGRLQLSLRPLLLRALLDQVVALLEPLSRVRAIDIALDCPEDLVVEGDASRVRQVLINLLSNAVKYNHMAGRIDVAVRLDGPHAVIDVRDTGVGMSAESLAQLFQPFNRVGAEQTRVEGAGLGLVIARGLAEAMGGALDVTSVLGQGTCFSLRLRVSTGTPAPTGDTAAAPGAAVQVQRDRPWQVLYVEDNTVNALLMEAALAAMPSIALHIAPDGASALRSAAQQRPDLLLLDLQLPDMDGFGLLERLRRELGLQQVPAVAVSADAMPDDVNRALAQGFTAYWTKPLQLTSLARNLEQILGGAAPG
ncbi:PAS domain-containing hybrid sensor histidine kinase/response regulator [Roseateles paludis]|uniref:histidine kinase n=1 Tax=Roseateles paludis TaxID=3145238 RepID=A0ABV0FYL9_9BURK